MIKEEIIQKIGILVKQGHMSQRQIAKSLGVSRGTVQSVAHGKRTKITCRRLMTPLWVVPSGQPKRCPFCGSWAKMPCLSCQLFAIDKTDTRPELEE